MHRLIHDTTQHASMVYVSVFAEVNDVRAISTICSALVSDDNASHFHQTASAVSVPVTPLVTVSRLCRSPVDDIQHTCSGLSRNSPLLAIDPVEGRE